jgi:hypothetical protein
MRKITTIRDTKRPTPENSAIETSSAVSEFCEDTGADEEMRAVFGMTALSSLWCSKNSCRYECLAATMKIQRFSLAHANTPQGIGAGQRPAKHFDPLDRIRELRGTALCAIDRRA